MRFTVLILALILLSPLVVDAATIAKPYHYQRIFYYTDSAAAKKSFYAHPGAIDIFAPQTYALESDGTLSGTLDQQLIDFAHAHKIQITPVVTNDDFTQDSYQGLLSDSAKEQIAISALILEAENRGYSGYQLDFEQMHAEYQQQYSDFVALLATALHAKHLTLSVAMIARFSNDPADYKGDLWENLIGVYDYAAIASSTDYVTIMTYDDPDSTGPVAEYSWVQKVLAFSLKQVPADKIALGIPLYYWQWNDATGKLVGVGGNDGIDTVLKKHPLASIVYNLTEHMPVLKYIAQGIHYTIWYENARSVAAKLLLVSKNKLYGAAFWQLGIEDPTIFTSVKE